MMLVWEKLEHKGVDAWQAMQSVPAELVADFMRCNERVAHQVYETARAEKGEGCSFDATFRC